MSTLGEFVRISAKDHKVSVVTKWPGAKYGFTMDPTAAHLIAQGIRNGQLDAKEDIVRSLEMALEKHRLELADSLDSAADVADHGDSTPGETDEW